MQLPVFPSPLAEIRGESTRNAFIHAAGDGSANVDYSLCKQPYSFSVNKKHQCQTSLTNTGSLRAPGFGLNQKPVSGGGVKAADLCKNIQLLVPLSKYNIYRLENAIQKAKKICCLHKLLPQKPDRPGREVKWRMPQ